MPLQQRSAVFIPPYRVEPEASLEDSQDCISALEDKPIAINDRNFPGLSQLSEEFSFQVLQLIIVPALRRFEADLALLAAELEAVREAMDGSSCRPASAGVPPHPRSHRPPQYR
jgi:hypothetical protein